MTDVAVFPESGLMDSAERIVVSERHGRASLVPGLFTTEGEVVRAGDVIARVHADGEHVEVRSPCNAWVLSYLIIDGERVAPGTAIAHLRAL